MIVTFGSCSRKAERRNLKLPVPTRRSVHARIADFWSFQGSIRQDADRDSAHRPCKRPSNASGLTVITMSTSGTATPNAVPLEMLPHAKPSTSASGSTGLISLLTARAMFTTVASPSAVGQIWFMSSSTSASKPTALNVGADTGMALGRRTSCAGAGASRGCGGGHCGEPLGMRRGGAWDGEVGTALPLRHTAAALSRFSVGDGGAPGCNAWSSM
mmetsp:Transcript_114823/g.357656  ORF Transcript_114823/g.357656 Transcript_114823/m.357656 type:complete len:215 (+) Transcript_114823:832-1476(+)